MSKYGRPPHGGSFDLNTLDSELRRGDEYARGGYASHTLQRENDLRIVITAMKAGSRMAEHRTDETAAIHALNGHIRLHLPDQAIDLCGGQLLVLKGGIQHDVEAVVASTFLLTLGWPPPGNR